MNSVRIPKYYTSIITAFLLAQAALAVMPDMKALCADQIAIERVYHEHRIGMKRSFEEAVPASLIMKNVRTNLRKEDVLRQRYGLEITDEMVEAEVKRIDTTTRAPEILAEIKAALGNDPERFARSMARPIVVERELRCRFDNDNELHAAQRKQAERARQKLMAGSIIGDMHEVTWKLGPRPEDNPSASATPAPQTQGKARGGLYSVEATAQIAQPLSSPDGEKQQQIYFEDLDPELQHVLRVQLRKAGDVSAVIEMPTGFLVFAAKEITMELLSASSISIPKQSYEMWLGQQEVQP